MSGTRIQLLDGFSVRLTEKIEEMKLERKCQVCGRDEAHGREVQVNTGLRSFAVVWVCADCLMAIYHQTMTSRNEVNPAAFLCSRCHQADGVERGAYGDWYCAACWKRVTNEGRPR